MTRLLVAFLLVSAGFCSAAKAPLKVFILAGQSNMEGKAKISLLEHQLAQPETRWRFAHLVDKAGKFKVREDVWIKFLARQGNLTVGYGSPKRIGPELEFGNTVGDHFPEQVLIIKTAWGGKSLFCDFRPPSSGQPSAEYLAGLFEQVRKRKSRGPKPTAEQIADSFGHYYRLMITEVKDTLADLQDHFPAYRGQGHEIAGLVWFQGWNDMVNEQYTAAYAGHMENFIRDVRKDLGIPQMPFVIGQLGVGGTKDEKPNPKRDRFKAAQVEPTARKEFKGNVAVVRTDRYWDETADAVFKKGWKNNFELWQTVGSDYPFHYLGSAKTYCDIGRAFGEAMLGLMNVK
jgi:hypothetical protein